MVYRFIFSHNATKEFEKLPKDVKERINKAFDRFKINPKRHAEQMVGEPYFKFKVGDYRLITPLEWKDDVIPIIKVGHRKNIYKKF